MVLAPRLLLSAYIDVDAPERAVMVALALRYLVVAAAFQLVDRRRLFWRARCAGFRIPRCRWRLPCWAIGCPALACRWRWVWARVARVWRVGRAGDGAGRGGGDVAVAMEPARGFGIGIAPPLNFLSGDALTPLGPAPISGALALSRWECQEAFST
jgi:hypothetical protein